MKEPHVIYESPSKANIAYSVLYMEKDKSIEDYFQWLVDEIEEKKTMATRTIIYCQTTKQCGTVYSTIRGMLGNKLYADSTNDMRKVVLEMLHSCTPEQNKETMLNAFQEENSSLRILVATIAFGMGVDCKAVYRTVHFGPSKNIEAYIQETGRAGRDGKQSVAYVIYQGLFLNHVDKDMKNYVKTSNCRRKTLLHNFDSTLTSISFPQPMHMCCDNCAIKCECGASDCGQLTTFPATRTSESEKKCSRLRQGTKEQRATLREHLYSYHKTLVMDLIKKSDGEQVRSLTKPQVLLRFSDLQVSQVLEHVDKLFTVEDICSRVEIWDMRHAFKILQLINEVYGDICDLQLHDFDDEFQYGFDCDDDVNEQWNDLLNDDSLFELAIENISLVELENSTFVDVSQDISGSGDVPGAALDALGQILIDD